MTISTLPIICYNELMVESKQEEMPIIVAFVTELMAGTRIRNIVGRLEYSLKIIDDGFERTEVSTNPLEGEPIQGPDALIFDQVTRWSPALIIIDLGDEVVPWKHWLIRLKSSPATKRIPVVCYGPHVQTDTLAEARSLAADFVVSRSRFFSDLSSIIGSYARDDDANIIAQSCQDILPETAQDGIEAFNRGDYFDAHEILEDAWNADQTAGRNFYKAIIQVAVAYLQIERSNYRGAYKMLLRSRQWFRGLPDVCRSVDVRSLKSDSESVYRALMQVGPEGIGDFDRALLRPIRIIKHE
jgi:hypothetical protein